VAYRPFPSKRGRNWRQQRLEIPLVTLLLDLPAHARILEVGCGCGIGLPIIAERCRPERLVGIDFDGGLLAEARPAIEGGGIRAELVEADVRRMPFEDGSFDVVIDFGTCYHIVRPWQALQEISRVLQPGGIFAHETPLNQLLSHPMRSGGRQLPWTAVPDLVPSRKAVLWETRRKGS
jgi:ubiquinone/menaquinone biosynthesis C-methylase UbiE